MKKGILYYLQLIFITPIWILYTPFEDKKSWKEFKSSLIKHKHEFDYDNPIHDYIGGRKNTCWPCKHFGCNLVTTKDKDGKYDWQK